jgi:prophage regulatory protein
MRNKTTLDDVRGQDLLSFRDLRLFGIRFSRAHIYRLINAGRFPAPVKVGGRCIAFRRKDIDRWIKELGTVEWAPSARRRAA